MPLVHVTDDELRSLSPRQLGQTVRDRITGLNGRRRRRSHTDAEAYASSAIEMMRGTGVHGDPDLKPAPEATDDED